MRSTGVARGAFSIIELVVVIGLVMVLLGVFLPVLGAAKSSAKQVRLASQIRQTATMVSAYCDEYDGVYPIADDRFWFHQYRDSNGRTPYEQGRHWAHALIDSGFFTEEEMLDPDVMNIGSMSLSMAMSFDPKYMAPDSLIPYKDRFTSPIRQGSVLYPSGKGMVKPIWVGDDFNTTWCCTQLSPPGPVAFADTSIFTVAWHELPQPEFAPILGIGYPVSTTWHGVLGRDR